MSLTNVKTHLLKKKNGSESEKVEMDKLDLNGRRVTCIVKLHENITQRSQFKIVICKIGLYDTKHPLFQFPETKGNENLYPLQFVYTHWEY